jgi:hypothetical protein
MRSVAVVSRARRGGVRCACLAVGLGLLACATVHEAGFAVDPAEPATVSARAAPAARLDVAGEDGLSTEDLAAVCAVVERVALRSGLQVDKRGASAPGCLYRSALYPAASAAPPEARSGPPAVPLVVSVSAEDGAARVELSQYATGWRPSPAFRRLRADLYAALAATFAGRVRALD